MNEVEYTGVLSKRMDLFLLLSYTNMYIHIYVCDNGPWAGEPDLTIVAGGAPWAGWPAQALNPFIPLQRGGAACPRAVIIFKDKDVQAYVCIYIYIYT